MADLLDQLLTEGVRKNSQEIKPLNAPAFLSGVGQLVGIRENKDEIARQNTIRNLIANAKKNGIPYTQLGDRIAQYDLDKAIKVSQDSRNSYDFNRGQDERELTNYKKMMAGWLGARVLRNAVNEVDSNPDKEWTFEYAVDVCNRAAAAIYPYDPSAAERLWSFGKQGLVKKSTNESREHFVKDHERDGRFLSSINSNIKVSADPNSDPNNYDRNEARYFASKRLMEWKANNPYTERNLNGRQLWSYMIDGLRAKAMSEHKGISKYTDEEISAMFPESAEIGIQQQPVNGQQTEQPAEHLSQEQNAAPGSPSYEKSKSSSKQNGIAVAAETSSAKNCPKDLTKKGRGNRTVLDRYKTKALQKFINEAVSDEELNEAKECIAASADLERDNSTVFSKLNKSIEERKKEINDLMSEAGNTSYEELLKLKKLVGAKNMNTLIVKQLRNFVNAMSGYTTTDTPYTSVTNWILVTQPDYKYIKDDIEMMKTLKTGNKWTDVKSVLSKTAPTETLRELLQREIAPNVMYAAAKDGTNAMRSWWNGLKVGKTEAQLEEAKKMYSNMFGIDPDFWPYIEGKARVPKPEDVVDLRNEAQEKEDNLPSLKEVQEKEKSKKGKPKKMTSEELKAWMESQKNGGKK